MQAAPIRFSFRFSRALVSGLAHFGCEDVYLVNEELWTLRGGGQQELDATVAVLDTD